MFEDFAIGDFRQIGNEIEDSTIVKKNGLRMHFFSASELKELFSGFSNSRFKVKKSKPITHKENLERAIINGIVQR